MFGTIASAMVGRLLAGMLFGVRAVDAETLVFTVSILGAVTAVAALGVTKLSR